MLWVAVEANEHELPLAVAETAKELAVMLGVRTDSVRKNYYMHKSGKSKYNLKYKIVKVEDAVEDEPAAVVERQ